MSHESHESHESHVLFTWWITSFGSASWFCCSTPFVSSTLALNPSIDAAKVYKVSETRESMQRYAKYAKGSKNKLGQVHHPSRSGSNGLSHVGSRQNMARKKAKN